MHPRVLLEDHEKVCRVFWSVEDHCFVGVCAHVPQLQHAAETASAAMRGILAQVRNLIAPAKSGHSVHRDDFSMAATA